MSLLSHYPTGAASLAGGRFVVSTRRHTTPTWGIYRGFSRCTRTAGGLLITVTPRQGQAHDDWAAELALPIAGVAPLLHVGAVLGGHGELDGLVEREPNGRPLSEIALPLAPDMAMALVRDVAAVLAEIHERDIVLGGLQPELIYVTQSARGVTLSGIAPRGPVFARAAGAREVGRAFRTTYAPPELAGRGGRATDVFSLCAMASHWLTGLHPFGGAQGSMSLSGLGRGGRAASGARAWAQALERGLSPDPRERPELMELLQELDSISAPARRALAA